MGPHARPHTIHSIFAAMMAVADSHHGTDRRTVGGEAVVRPPSQREKVEALGVLLGMLGVLLGLALTVGVPAPLGP
jgi:hypothetical protein